ncbi:MAG: hypothetical protein HQ523_02930 [Lentisphaerae bacterium]|nr:hypothetical protein [Lentisphaerota bacterium]
MSEKEQAASDDGPDSEGTLDLNFVPDWARKPPQLTQWRDEAPRGGGRGGGGRSRDDYRGDRRDDRRGRSAPGRGPRPPRRGHDDSRGDRPPRSDAPDPGRRPQQPPRESPQPAGAPPRPRPTGGQGPREHSYRPPRPPREPRLPLDVRITPDQQGVQAVARRVHNAWMAYPVMELAAMFLSRPELSRIRIEVLRGNDDLALFQCQVCDAVARDHDTAVSHLISTHLSDYYEREDIMTDPPTGTFVCVARCGLSGTLLGPPNHHSYGQRVQEVHDTQYPAMDIEAYRTRIQTVREPEVIEQWKDESRKRTVYRRKDQPEGDEVAEAMEYEQVVALFRTEKANRLIKKGRKASVPAPVALYMNDIPLRDMIRRMWEHEESFPLKISFALRAAFRHMHLHVFKAGEGVHFVTRVAPSALNPEHVVEGIREVLLYLNDHPGSTRAQLVEGLRPGSAKDSAVAHEVLAPLGWMIERGHIIEFFNGTLSVPMNRRSTPHAKPKRHGKPRGGAPHA